MDWFSRTLYFGPWKCRKPSEKRLLGLYVSYLVCGNAAGWCWSYVQPEAAAWILQENHSHFLLCGSSPEKHTHWNWSYSFSVCFLNDQTSWLFSGLYDFHLVCGIHPAGGAMHSIILTTHRNETETDSGMFLGVVLSLKVNLIWQHYKPLTEDWWSQRRCLFSNSKCHISNTKQRLRLNN